MKKEYFSPKLRNVHLCAEVLIAVSLTSTQGAEDLGVGGTTQENGIFAGNVKTNTIEWDDWSQ